jgi:hypothetical protein
VIIWGVGEHPTAAMMANPMPAAEDTTMQTQLQAKGLTVDMVQDSKATPAAVMGKAIFIVSSSVNRAGVMASLEAVAVPAIVSKDGVLEPFGMASATSVSVMGTQIAIALPSDPLAAGLTGTVTATTKADRLIASTVGASATTVASLVGMPTQVAIYYYGAGQMMAKGTAPAKRVGFFIHRDTDLSPDGIKLFNAAVDWCLQP